MICHAQLEIGIDSIWLDRNSLLKVFGSEFHILSKQVLIIIFYRLSILAIRTTKIVQDIIRTVTRHLGHFELVDSLWIVLAIHELESQTICPLLAPGFLSIASNARRLNSTISGSSRKRSCRHSLCRYSRRHPSCTLNKRLYV